MCIYIYIQTKRNYSIIGLIDNSLTKQEESSRKLEKAQRKQERGNKGRTQTLWDFPSLLYRHLLKEKALVDDEMIDDEIMR